jgi:hypothetical protein
VNSRICDPSNNDAEQPYRIAIYRNLFGKCATPLL